MSVRCSVDDAVAWITLDRPEVMNVISIELATALTAAVTGCAADPAVNAIVVRVDSRPAPTIRVWTSGVVIRPYLRENR